MALILIENIDQLRLGLYVKIKGSWFSHPFSVSSFKIKTAKELEILRGLTRVKLYYDPTRSDPDPNAIATDTTSDEETSMMAMGDSEAASLENQKEDLRTEGSDPEPVEESLAETKEKAASLQKQRSQIFQEQMTHLKKVESTYSKVLKDSETIFNNLIASRPESIKAAKQVVSGMVDVFRHQSVSMTLMEVLGRNGLGWGLSTHSLNVSALS